MPDGDRFLRKLRWTGRGWGKAYSLACNNSVFLLAQISKALANNMRNFSAESIAGAIGVLSDAFGRETYYGQTNLLPSSNIFLTLENEYRLLNVKGDFDLVNILEKSVKSVFIANKNGSATMTDELIAEKLGETLSLNIMDSRWMSRVRDGVMVKQNRDFIEQQMWEQDLKGKVLPIARKMMKNFFKGKYNKKFRAPSYKQAKRATSELMNQRMPVLSQI